MDLPLHYLVCNAGVMNTPFGVTEDGIETQFGVFNPLFVCVCVCLIVTAIALSSDANASLSIVSLTTRPPISLVTPAPPFPLQVNHMGHFMLVQLLLPKLVASAPARIALVSSTAHYGGTAAIDNFRNNYSDGARYAPWRTPPPPFSCCWCEWEPWLCPPVAMDSKGTREASVTPKWLGGCERIAT